MPNEQWFLKAIRKELGLRQEDLASAAKTSQIDISNMERGLAEPTKGQVTAIVRAISARAAGRAFEQVILSAWPEEDA